MKLKDIRDKFETREIKPSDDSWDRLSTMLDDQEQSNDKKPLIYWLGAIAAVLILAVLAAPMLQSNNELETLNNDALVVDEKPIEEEQKVSSNQDEKSIPNPVIEKSDIDDAVAAAPVEVKDHSRDNSRKAVGTKKSSTSKSYEIATVKESESIDAIAITDKAAVSKNEEIDSAISNPNIVSKTTSIDEANRLIDMALQNMETRTMVTDVTINPNQLLRETEWDLEARKQDRLQNIVQDGFQFLKKEAVTYINKRN